MASDQNKLADEGLCFLRSVVVIRSEQTSCAHKPSPNTAAFTAFACQLKHSTHPICLLLVDRLIFSAHGLLVDLMEDFQTKDFHQL